MSDEQEATQPTQVFRPAPKFPIEYNLTASGGDWFYDKSGTDLIRLRKELVDAMTSEEVLKIKHINNINSITVTIKEKCPHCGVWHMIESFIEYL